LYSLLRYRRSKVQATADKTFISPRNCQSDRHKCFLDIRVEVINSSVTHLVLRLKNGEINGEVHEFNLSEKIKIYIINDR